MYPIQFLAPDGATYPIDVEYWTDQRGGQAPEGNWEAHLLGAARQLSGAHSPIRPRRGVGWGPTDAHEAAALALTRATAPDGQPMQTVIVGGVHGQVKGATSIPTGADWRPAAAALFTRHLRWLFEGQSDGDPTADYAILDERVLRTESGCQRLHVTLTTDGAHPESPDWYTVVIYTPEG